MNQAAKHQLLAAEAARAYHSSHDLTIKDFVYIILFTIAVLAIGHVIVMPAVHYDDDPEPQLFMRLVEAQGLDPFVDVPELRSPFFELAIEADRVPESKQGPCAGGGDDATLWVSYRGIILAWASVPRFCIDGMQGSSPSVATLVATAEGSVLREELRNMIRAETQALGRVEFVVEGSLAGLGHLRCITYLFPDEPTESLPPCHF